MLKVKNLTISVKGKIIIDAFNFNFEKNKVYAIMGPNGSGKSTLAYTIMGHPTYVVKRGNLIFNGEDISKDPPDKRSKKGIFLSFQSPMALSGVSVFQFLRLAASGVKDPLTVKREIDSLAKKLEIKDELIHRSLNDGASGGERKKLEVLQAAILDPKLLIFDEVDTGVDIDALKIIANYIDAHKKGKTSIIITHYNRILHYIKPDYVLMIIRGKLIKVGDYKLAEKIEKEGYEKIMNK